MKLILMIKNINCNRALSFTSQEGHLKIVKLLLDKGADVNLEGEYKNTALIKASEKWTWEIAETSLERSINIIHRNINDG